MILLINDDGIHAPGLRALFSQLRERTGEPVIVVAPVAQQSGQAHSITLDRGLTISPHLEEHFFGFAVDGTPTDCLKLGLTVICPTRPKLVVSGINDGPNVGRSLFYSGTVAAAMEAAVEGQAAIAVSRERGATSYTDAARFTADFAGRCLGRRDLRGRVLNINLPASPREQWGPLNLVPHGLSGYEENYRPQRSGNRLTWRLAGTRIEHAHEAETDAHLLKDGRPTLSVLAPDYNSAKGLSKALTERLLAPL